jgi:hypothetical protein
VHFHLAVLSASHNSAVLATAEVWVGTGTVIFLPFQAYLDLNLWLGSGSDCTEPHKAKIVME